MLKKLAGKIERVRQQPEHIRLRYVWGSVAVSMLIVFVIWIFSIGTLFKGDKNTTSQDPSAAPDITEQLKTLKDQAPSIKDLTPQIPAVGKEGIANSNNTSDFQYPATANDSTINPQANSYSDLPGSTLAQ